MIRTQDKHVVACSHAATSAAAIALPGVVAAAVAPTLCVAPLLSTVDVRGGGGGEICSDCGAAIAEDLASEGATSTVDGGGRVVTTGADKSEE